MPRLIELEVEGVIASATLLDEDAPLTANHLWTHLPLELRFGQSKWSGENYYAHSAKLAAPSLPPENATVEMIPAHLHFGRRRGELGITYGLAESRGPGGTTSEVAAVAAIRENYAAFIDALHQAQCSASSCVIVRRKP